MTNKQKEAIIKVKSLLKRGDINAIAKATGFAREHVTRCLTVSKDLYNQQIINAAIEIIQEKDNAAKKSIKVLENVQLQEA